MFEIYFVTVDKHQGFISSTVKRHISGWTFVQQRWKFVCEWFQNCWLFLRTACYDRLQASM